MPQERRTGSALLENFHFREKIFMTGCIPPNALDRWSIDARLIAHSGGLATIEFAMTNQVLGALPSFRSTIEWKAGMEAADVEARGLLVAAQSLRWLSQACVDAASDKIK